MTRLTTPPLRFAAHGATSCGQAMSRALTLPHTIVRQYPVEPHGRCWLRGLRTACSASLSWTADYPHISHRMRLHSASGMSRLLFTKLRVAVNDQGVAKDRGPSIVLSGSAKSEAVSNLPRARARPQPHRPPLAFVITEEDSKGSVAAYRRARWWDAGIARGFSRTLTHSPKEI